jgi:predicted transcriptional regulator
VSETATSIELAAEVVASYVANHRIATGELPALIKSVNDAFATSPAPSAPAVSGPTKAQIRKSVTAEALVSFEDGRRYRVLHRHLAKHALTPEAYRAKWGLPHDYPMVSPAYHEQRSALAKARGLGRRAAPPQPAPEPSRARKSRAQKPPVA